ncbi:MAG: hypothetical protein LW860_08945 [Xanthomonadaceae bacterium]|nr:hypothetical protein [Xanthomonadaceae bacterium]
MKQHLLFLALLAGVSGAAAAQAPAPATRFDAATISGLNARNIGSATMSGRISAIAAHLDDGKVTIYAGAASGGVWKSTDGGTTYQPIFDRQPVQSIGAIALDPRDPKTVWVGTGESWTRNSVSIGNGIYRSKDGGDTWEYLGLPGTERITKILVHPQDGNVVFACAPGALWSDSKERGLFRTTDGGKTWQQVLSGPNASTGCSGVTMDPQDPRKLFAGTWDFRRKGWTFRSGGEGPEAFSGSGLYRSNDGGSTWTELAAGANGLPNKPYGRIEVEIAPTDAKRVYAFIEGVDSALYVSSDGGATWEQRDKSQMMVWRPFYFANLVVDPTNADRLFKMNLRLIVSEDGGRSFSDSAGSTHADSHDLWINPTNPKHLVLGDDGGMWYSHDGGSRWDKSENLPISQFYHVAVDEQDPYQVYGGLQDNSSWIGDSQYPGGITNDRWNNIYGGDGFWVLPDNADPRYVYAEYQGGNLAVFDRQTRQSRAIQPKAGAGEKLRFNWNTPIHLSPTAKGTLYVGAQYLFRTRDRGQSWERISPDLTTNDPRKQQQELSGGITVDNSSAEMHTTIYSISESPLDGRVIWIGTDDGQVQLTRDGGANWTNLTRNLKGLPKENWISWVEASRHDPGTAYVVVDRHTFGDMDPHVFRTTDYGRSWTRVAAAAQGIRGYAHVVKEDLVDPELLYLGTEKGLWISNDGGGRWAEFKGGNFPAVAVRDLALQARENDLVIGTHGRGIWIIDDLTPLRALDDATLARDAAFLPSRPVQQRIAGVGGWSEGDAKFAGANPQGGAVITYYQRTRHLFGPIKIEILDAAGKLVDTIPASKRRGINRVSWSMRVAPPRAPKGAQAAFNATQGPRVLPGTYTVRLTKGKEVYETTLQIGLDRRADYSVDDRKAQFDAAMRTHALFGRMSGIADRIQMAQALAGRAGAGLGEGERLKGDLARFGEELDAVRRKIVATKEGGAITGELRLREHTDELYGALLGYEGRPGDYLLARIEVLSGEIAAVGSELDVLLAQRLPKLNDALRDEGQPPIELPPMPAVATADVSSADLQGAFATFLGRPWQRPIRISKRR